MIRIRTVVIGLAVGTLALSACGGEGPAEGDRGQTAAEWVACSTTMVVGDVASVSPSARHKGRISVTVEATEWLKPVRGERRITLDVVDPGATDTPRQVKPGQHLLIAVPERDSLEPGVFRGDQLRLERARIKKALPASETTKCPYPWASSSS
ncbi:hypothetical protein [Streptomyces sp. BK340]|uniref:hypothetical protein n=1 Tax=Streptomyces sp. BK340 TaxID=2572903 RepID=UPI0011A66DA9|nr:hypothetical protein [Streptomyces sp. BK340]TVZ77727.1 hypothetical protein FB157_13733 [Streptomyces sp. BK340]